MVFECFRFNGEDHEKGNIECEGCFSGDTELCPCGGVVHCESYDATDGESYEPIVHKKCDKCETEIRFVYGAEYEQYMAWYVKAYAKTLTKGERKKVKKELLGTLFAKFIIEQYIRGVTFLHPISSVLVDKQCSVKVKIVSALNNWKTSPPEPIKKQYGKYTLTLSTMMIREDEAWLDVEIKRSKE